MKNAYTLIIGVVVLTATGGAVLGGFGVYQAALLLLGLALAGVPIAAHLRMRRQNAAIKRLLDRSSVKAHTPETAAAVSLAELRDLYAQFDQRADEICAALEKDRALLNESIAGFAATVADFRAREEHIVESQTENVSTLSKYANDLRRESRMIRLVADGVARELSSKEQ